ncbi:Cullin binding-domain-containing protein [Pelagophyceae sp. CCMP2097]|nr:Cullin binding-domain-containing protein [Pelagophyceae sp. CCMP2097]
MAPAKKRKAAAPAANKPGKVAKGKKTATPLDFERYWDADEDCVTGDGLEKLCGELGVDASTDTRLLAMCWRLGAEKPGVLQRGEWGKFASCQDLPTCGNASLEALRDNWGSLDPAFLENSEFRPFFKFCFEFNREGTQKFLDRDAALALLPLCIENRSPHSAKFVEFLGTKPTDFKLNRDQWCSFLDFSIAVGPAPEFRGWIAEESSWPILLDEFVEFAKQPMA